MSSHRPHCHSLGVMNSGVWIIVLDACTCQEPEWPPMNLAKGSDFCNGYTLGPSQCPWLRLCPGLHPSAVRTPHLDQLKSGHQADPTLLRFLEGGVSKVTLWAIKKKCKPIIFLNWNDCFPDEEEVAAVPWFFLSLWQILIYGGLWAERFTSSSKKVSDLVSDLVIYGSIGKPSPPSPQLQMFKKAIKKECS